MDPSDIFDRLRADVTAQVFPGVSVVLIALGAVLLCLAVPALWHVVRHVVTVAHEGGHAVVAILAGRRVRGIRLHADTSGATVSTGQARGFPLALKAFAGYPAPGVIGLAAAWALSAGYAYALLWAVVASLVVVLASMRNVYGFLVVALSIAAFAAAAWMLPDPWRLGLAYGIAWLLLVGAVRAVVELHGSRSGGRGRGSDADALARITRVPAGVWVALFWLATVGCAVAGGWLLLRGV